MNVKNILPAMLLALGLIAIVGCGDKVDAPVGDGPMERTGEKMDDAAEKTGEALEKAGEKTGEAVEDAGEKMQ